MATAKKIESTAPNANSGIAPTDNTASTNPIKKTDEAPAWDIVRLERTLLQICDRADSLTGSANDRGALANLLRDMATLVESAPAGLNLTHPDLPGVSVNAQRGIMLIARIGKAFATAGKTRSTLFGKAARK